MTGTRVCVCVWGGPLKFSIYIGEADCFLKISNFRMFWGFSEKYFLVYVHVCGFIYLIIFGGRGGVWNTSKFGYFYGLF